MSFPRAQVDFVAVERTLVNWWEHHQFKVLQEFSEWFAEVDGVRISISAQALAVVQALEGRS